MEGAELKRPRSHLQIELAVTSKKVQQVGMFVHILLRYEVHKLIHLPTSVRREILSHRRRKSQCGPIHRRLLTASAGFLHTGKGGCTSMRGRSI
jgi:hypothetical protein